MIGNKINEMTFCIAVKSQILSAEQLDHRISCCIKTQAALCTLNSLAIEDERNSGETLNYLDIIAGIAENKNKASSLVVHPHAIVFMP